jgi:hypothetical protein
VLPLLLGGKDWLPWTPTRAAADPGWPEREPDAGRDREQEWPVTAVLVEPAVGEFADLSAPGLLELGRRSKPSSGTRVIRLSARRWHAATMAVVRPQLGQHCPEAAYPFPGLIVRLVVVPHDSQT